MQVMKYAQLTGKGKEIFNNGKIIVEFMNGSFVGAVEVQAMPDPSDEITLVALETKIEGYQDYWTI